MTIVYIQPAFAQISHHNYDTGEHLKVNDNQKVNEQFHRHLHLASVRAPDAHSLVITARHDLATVIRNGDSKHSVCVTLEHLEYLYPETMFQ